MNFRGIIAPAASTIAPPKRWLTLGVLSVLALSACGGPADLSAQTAEESASASSSSATASTSSSAESAAASGDESSAASQESAPSDQAASTETEATAEGEQAPADLTENGQAAEALANAEEIAVDAEEVKTTENLLGQVQDVLSSVQPQPEAALLEGNADTLEGEQSVTNPSDYLPDEVETKLKESTTGSAFDQYVNAALEYSLNGWTTSGKPKVVGTPKMSEGTYEGQKAKFLEVCLDASEVTVEDGAGNVLTNNQHARSLNIFTLVQDGGSWKIASHDFPNNADC